MVFETLVHLWRRRYVHPETIKAYSAGEEPVESKNRTDTECRQNNDKVITTMVIRPPDDPI